MNPLTTRSVASRLRSALFFAFAFFALSPFLAHAQSAYPTEALPSDEVVGDFVVGPGKIELSLLPGQSRTIELVVSNRMGDERIFSIAVEDVRGSENPEQTVVLLGDGRGPHSVRDYLSFTETQFVLPHARRARVPVTVSVPADAEPGGYYGSVLLTTTSNRTDLDNGMGARGAAAVVSRIGVLFFITVPGDVEKDGALESFSLRGDQQFFLKGPIAFQMLFRNSGNVHLNPFGQIEIRNILGRTVDRVVVEPWFALPDSLRLREVIWEQNGLIGRYTAVASVNRGYDGIVETAEVTFWVVPVVPIALAFGGIFLVVLLVWFLKRRFVIARR